MGLTNYIRMWTDALLTGGTRDAAGTGDLAMRVETIPLDVFTGDQLFLLPREDDLGELHIGDGTKDMDVKVFLGSTADFFLLDVGTSKVLLGSNGNGLDCRMFGATSGSKLFWDESTDTLELDAAILGEHRRPAATTKVAAYTVVEGDSGTIFDTTGDLDSITFTLPDVTLTGFHCWFFQVADQEMVIASAVADIMVLDNDAVASTLTFTALGEHIGNMVYVISDGTKWLVAISRADETVTSTVGA